MTLLIVVNVRWGERVILRGDVVDVVCVFTCSYFQMLVKLEGAFKKRLVTRRMGNPFERK
jgi:hypothetical protein